jgi:hypothetical protein
MVEALILVWPLVLLEVVGWGFLLIDKLTEND